MRVDCAQCLHPASEHGTYGCLFGWERARYSESIIMGCRCNQRFVNPRSCEAPNIPRVDTVDLVE
jgi:hypothetical protein